MLHILAPTINFQAGDIANIPVLTNTDKEEYVTKIAKKNVEISKEDWDAFETSWDFKKHPLLCYAYDTVSAAFEAWSNECDNRFNQLKANEEIRRQHKKQNDALQ